MVKGCSLELDNLLLSCVTSDKPHNFSGLQFFRQSGGSYETCLQSWENWMVKGGEPLHRGEHVQHVGGPESLTVSSSTASNDRHSKTGICWSELYSMEVPCSW